jgi:hypothetical protein
MDLKMVTTTSAPNTNVEYDGDNPLPLAEEIDAALDYLGNGRMFAVKLFEGELRLIADSA